MPLSFFFNFQKYMIQFILSFFYSKLLILFIHREKWLILILKKMFFIEPIIPKGKKVLFLSKKVLKYQGKKR